MVRFLSLSGLAALFLMISPKFRGHISGGILAFVSLLERNSPYSYILAVLGVIAVFTISLNRGAQPR